MYDGSVFRISEDRVVSDLTPDFKAMVKRISEALARYREQHILNLVYGSTEWPRTYTCKLQKEPRIVGNELVFDDE